MAGRKRRGGGVGRLLLLLLIYLWVESGHIQQLRFIQQLHFLEMGTRRRRKGNMQTEVSVSLSTKLEGSHFFFSSCRGRQDLTYYCYSLLRAWGWMDGAIIQCCLFFSSTLVVKYPTASQGVAVLSKNIRYYT